MPTPVVALTTSTAPVFHILSSFLALYKEPEPEHQTNELEHYRGDEDGIYNHYESQDMKKACRNIYNIIHCFSLEPPWVGIQRPEALAPWSQEIIGTTFTLVTRRSRTFPVNLDPSNIKTILEAPYNVGKEWKIIIHGFDSGMDRPWVKEMVDQLLITSNMNIVLTDWSQGALRPYQQAIANCRLVGVQLAYLIYYLHKYADVKMKNIHIIGHSLGAHTAGYAGAHLQDAFGLKINRITALDPAHPSFENEPDIVTLDPSDASFIDVIHTDNNYILGTPLTLGLQKSVGHIDFFPNNAKNQPGCDDTVACDHTIAVTLFTESIRQSCPYIGVACPSYENFTKGLCWSCEYPNECIEMGMNAHPPKTQEHFNFYLMTREKVPHCGYHYRISVEFSNSTEAKYWEYGHGIIAVEVEGVSDKLPWMKLTEMSVLYHYGETYHYVIVGPDIGDIISMKMSFSYPSTWLNPIPLFHSPQLHIAAISIQKLREKTNWRFCFLTEKIEPQKEQILKKNQCNTH